MDQRNVWILSVFLHYQGQTIYILHSLVFWIYLSWVGTRLGVRNSPDPQISEEDQLIFSFFWITPNINNYWCVVKIARAVDFHLKIAVMIMGSVYHVMRASWQSVYIDKSGVYKWNIGGQLKTCLMMMMIWQLNLLVIGRF